MPEAEGLLGASRETLRLWLLLMQDGRCCLCGQGFDLTAPQRTYGAVSLEHKMPRVEGGSDHRHNMAVSHCECNYARGRALRLKLFRPGPKFRRIPMMDKLRRRSQA